MMRFFYKIIFLSLSLSLIACKPSKDYHPEQKTELKIVDMQGKSHNVKMRTPELNVQALAAQGNLNEEKLAMIDNNKVKDPEIAQNKYASNNYQANSNEALQDTLNLPQNPNTQVAAPVVTAGMIAKNENQTVEYDLTSDRNDKSLKNKKADIQNEILEEPKPTAVSTKKQKGIFVQTGSFSVMKHAQNSVAKVKQASGNSNVKVEEVMVNNKIVYRVLIGPFATKPKASAMVAKLEKSGNNAIIVRNP